MRKGRVRHLGVGVLALALLALVASVVGHRPGDPALFPPRGVPAGTLSVVVHGYHTGLAFPVDLLRRVATDERLPVLAEAVARFPVAAWIEIGWGDEGFYRRAPTRADLTVLEAARALFLPGNPSVLHMVGLYGPPQVVFPFADIVDLPLSGEGLRRLVRALDVTFARDVEGRPVDLGVGLYGPSLFFRATGYFHIARVCNHWVGDLLASAGVPVNLTWATHPVGLLPQLRGIR